MPTTKPIGVLTFLIFALTTHAVASEGRLGLHVSRNELSIWKRRAVEGPFRSQGDTSPNSPGDWDRITKNAKNFRAAPADEIWNGHTNDSCAADKQGFPSRRYGVNLRDAAFYYLIVGDASYREHVKNALVKQAALAGTDFSNERRWCRHGVGYLEVASWINRLLFAYDYIRNDIGTDDRSRLDAWFLNAGYFLEANVHASAAKRWPNRKANVYGASPMPLGPPRGNIYFGAPIVYGWHLAWNNIFGVMTRTSGLIGIMLQDDFLKNEAKRWFKEALRYIVWHKNTDNIATHGEYMRCCWKTISHFPTLGFHYVSSSLLSLVMLADAFSRIGDNELFTYSTAEGYNSTEGGPKTLKAVIETHLKMMNHTIVRYGTDKASDVGKTEFIIDDYYEPKNWHHVGAAWFVGLANRYYKDNSLTRASSESNPRNRRFPRAPASSGVDGWMGDHGTFPGVLFMFGNMPSGN